MFVLNNVENKAFNPIQSIEIDTTLLSNKTPAKNIITTRKLKTAQTNKNQIAASKLNQLFPSSVLLQNNEGEMKSDFDLHSPSSISWKQAESYYSTSSNLSDYGSMEMSEINFIKNLWTRIDNSIIESKYLAEYGHAGHVYFQFEVSKEGKLIDETIKVSADDAILKVLAVRSIKKSIDSLENKLEKSITVNAKFSWTDDSGCNKNIRTHKNFLSFCRLSNAKRKSFDTAEKAKVYLGALTYGFSAAEEIKKYRQEEKRRETKFDPFEELRRDPDYFLGS